jgi:hypothetical protein
MTPTPRPAEPRAVDAAWEALRRDLDKGMIDAPFSRRSASPNGIVAHHRLAIEGAIRAEADGWWGPRYRAIRAESSAEALDALDAFVADAAAEMRERLEHGARKFGRTSWRDETYIDFDNLERVRRAVDHLAAACRNTDDPAEWAKRAADVANQAFMLADPARQSRTIRAANQDAYRTRTVPVDVVIPESMVGHPAALRDDDAPEREARP